jgi:2-dehydropantoate 2-reductase
MVEDTPDIEAAMWQKLVFIAAFSGVGSVTRAPAGILRRIPQTYQMLRDAMQEIVDVARARQIALTEDAVEKGMVTFDGMPDEGTASMQRDITEGRPSELDGQIGAVVRLGAEVGVAAPIHQFIYRSLLPLEMKARGLLP